ncbi:MAG: CoA pyrophosphatase [Pseudomonadota bacterium]|jgi:8-oxo-dGTP pyrophosphatase MutT (NUDIX family)
MSPSASLTALEPLLVERLRPLGEDAPAAGPVPAGQVEPPGKVGDLLAPAAVLIPLVTHPHGLSVLLTQRAEGLRKHAGQVAFPGGRSEFGETAVQTALREAQEEIGLDPTLVRPIGLGDVFESGSGYIITPVVAAVQPGFSLDIHAPEVAAVFETPFAFLMDETNHEARSYVSADGRERRYYAMTHGDRLIWGVTAAILRALRQRLFG